MQLRILYLVLGILTLALYIAEGILVFTPDWDTLTLHLPGALMFAGQDAFVPEQFVQDYIVGTPPLAHVIQAISLKMAGVPQGMAWLNIFGLLILVVSFIFTMGNINNTGIFFLALCSLPQAMIHIYSGFIDFWSGSIVASAAIWLMRFNRMVAMADLKEKSSDPFCSLIISVLLLAVAIASRYQTWPGAIVVLSFGLWSFRRYVGSFGVPSRIRSVILLCGLSLFFYWPITNQLRHGNPVFPVRVPIIGDTSKNWADLRNPIMLKHQPPYVDGMSNFQKFWESSLELGRLRYPFETFNWSVDQANYIDGERGPFTRMGGWFCVTWILLLYSSCKAFKKGLRFEAGLFWALILLTSMMPQSHELRYWFYLPFLGAAILARQFDNDDSNLVARSVLPVLWAITTVFNLHGLGFTKAWLFESMAPPEARAAWAYFEQNPGVLPCDIAVPHPHAVWWSGPNFDSYKVYAQAPAGTDIQWHQGIFGVLRCHGSKN